MTSPPSVSPVIPNVEAPREKQTAIEELRSNARTSRRISSNFSKKVLRGKSTVAKPMLENAYVMKAENKTSQKDLSFVDFPPDAVLVGYEEESEEKTTFRTTPSQVHNNSDVAQDRGQDFVVVQSLLRSSRLTTPTGRVTPGPRPVYDPNMEKKVKRISPASTNITVSSPAKSLSLLPSSLLGTKNPKTLVFPPNQTIQTQTTTTSKSVYVPETTRAVKKHAETQKLISGVESSMKINFISLGIMTLFIDI